MNRHIFKRSTKEKFIVVAISVTVVCVFFGIIFFQVKSNFNSKINDLSKIMEDNTRNIYVAKTDIPAGEMLKKENLTMSDVYSSLPVEYFITSEDVGKQAIVDIKLNTHILKNMITEEKVDDGIREGEYNTFFLSSNLKENDVVDIRILYPNGEDYVVLTKKNLKGLSMEKNNCFLWLNEEEILYFFSNYRYFFK